MKNILTGLQDKQDSISSAQIKITRIVDIQYIKKLSQPEEGA